MDCADRLKQLDAAIKEAACGCWLTVGRVYRFACEHGSHYHVLEGKIVGIQLSDEGGLQLEVSNRTMWGRPIDCLMFQKESGWMIKLHTSYDGDPFFPGYLELR